MTGALLAILVVAFIVVVLVPVAKEELEVEPEPPERVADWIGMLNYGTAPGAAEAERRILSLGARVTPELFVPIVRLHRVPNVLTADTQLRVEELLVDFGLAGVMASASDLERLELQHRAYPSAIRWLSRLGPVGVEPVFRAGLRAEALYLVPLVARQFDAFAAYEQHEGARLPPAQRTSLQHALASVWMAQHLGTPEGVGWAQVVTNLRTTSGAVPAGAVTDAAARERLVDSVRSRSPGWQTNLPQVASFATDVAVDAVSRTLRQSPETLSAEVLAACIAAGLPASRVCPAMVDALRTTRSVDCCQMARQIPVTALAPVVFASIGRQCDVEAVVTLELTLAASGSLSELVVDALEHDDATVQAGATIVASRMLISTALAPLVAHALHEEREGHPELLIAIELFGAAAQRPLAQHWGDLGAPPSPPLERVRTLVSRLAERETN